MTPTLQLILGLCAIALTVSILFWLFIKLEPPLAGIMNGWLGANWRTTLWGGVNNVAVFVMTASASLLAAYANPTLDPTWGFIIKLIPQYRLPWLLGAAGLVKLVAGFLASRAQKSAEVSGGAVLQDDRGNVLRSAPASMPGATVGGMARVGLLSLLVAALALGPTACTTHVADAADASLPVAVADGAQIVTTLAVNAYPGAAPFVEMFAGAVRSAGGKRALTPDALAAYVAPYTREATALAGERSPKAAADVQRFAAALLQKYDAAYPSLAKAENALPLVEQFAQAVEKGA